MLGKHIVMDPDICHGKPTVVGTRIMVWQILSLLAEGYSHKKISAAWRGRVSQEAIVEAIQLAEKAFVEHASEYGSEQP